MRRKITPERVEELPGGILALINHDTGVLMLNESGLKGFNKDQIKFIINHEVGHYKLGRKSKEIDADRFALKRMIKEKGTVQDAIGILKKSENVSSTRIKEAERIEENLNNMNKKKNISSFNGLTADTLGGIDLTSESISASNFDFNFASSALNGIGNIANAFTADSVAKRQSNAAIEASKNQLAAAQATNASNQSIAAANANSLLTKETFDSQQIKMAIIGLVVISVIVVGGIVLSKFLKKKKSI